MDADCSLAASLLALDSEAAWELPELVLWEELAVPLEAEAEPAGEAVLSLLEEL